MEIESAIYVKLCTFVIANVNKTIIFVLLPVVDYL